MTYIYPSARRDDTIVDDFFGTKVADPYRWMEDPSLPEVRTFIDEQNDITHEFLQTSLRAEVKTRLQKLFQHAHVPAYRQFLKRGGDYFFSYNVGQDQAAVMRRRGKDGTDEIVLDPNTLSSDGSAILMGTYPSGDAKLLTYSISRGGSDWQECFIRDLETGKDLPDHLKWCKFAIIVWSKDNSGFYYNRFPEPQQGQELLAGNFNASIYYHKVGTPQSDDRLIYNNPDAPGELFWPQGTDDGDYLLLNVRPSAAGANGYAYWRIGSDQPFTRLLNDFDTNYDFVGNEGRVFYFLTKAGALRRRVVAIDLDNPARENWKEIMPEAADTLSAVHRAGDQFIATYQHNAHSVMKAFSLDGKLLREIPLPAMGSIPTNFLDMHSDAPDFLFTFTSFLFPMTVYRYDTATNQLELFKASETPVDATTFETRQVFVPSSDGAQVSLFITHRKGLKLDGTNPTVLYAYGGFDISINPEFELPYYLWMENGGVYAVANLRGGGEFGEDWHKAGMRENKQHVFDDMINAAKWLIANSYTSSAHLAISGVSNGGLLVSTCVTQQPDLFGAGLCGVPVTDMLRYQKFTSGRLWVSEYGSAEDSEEEFRYLYAYSPLHNVRPGVTYPPMLIWSSDGDDRVVPMHSLKFTATIQAADSGKNPILLRFGTQVGHGTVNINKLVEEESDVFSFLASTIGWKLQP